MTNPLSRITNRVRAAIPDKHQDQQRFDETRELMEGLRDLIDESTEKVLRRIDQSDEVQNEIREIASKNFDHIHQLRKELKDVRTTQEYAELYTNKNPLVSVRIATWNNPDLLIDRAIKSVQSQTYDNWELVVVGDGCDDDTEKNLKALNDERIIFYNFPHRNIYPADPIKRWQVAGSPGMNKGAELAKGDWIAPLDDDDEFTEDHIEVLVNKAYEGNYEFVYGDVAYVTLADNKTGTLSSYPPVKGGISSQAFIYPKLLGFFEWETLSWVVDEPGDWNIVRRMMESGVTIGKVDQVVSTIYSMTPELKTT